MNPFYIGYSKAEDKVTALFFHILEQSGLTTDFLTEISWEDKHFPKCNIDEIKLQLHTKFPYPVENAFILGISNSDEAPIEKNDFKVKDGNPDGYFYDTKTKTLVLFEAKVGKGKLTSHQIEGHKAKVHAHTNWGKAFLAWKSVRDYFQRKLGELPIEKEYDLQRYLLQNFIGFLSVEVIQDGVDIGYFFYQARRNQALVERILDLLNANATIDDMRTNIGNRKCIELYLKNTKNFAAIDLKNSRLILKPGRVFSATDPGLIIRYFLREHYGIYYQQKEKAYPYEYSIPFANISLHDLTLIPEEGRELTEKIDLSYLLSLTLDPDKYVEWLDNL